LIILLEIVESHFLQQINFVVGYFNLQRIFKKVQEWGIRQFQGAGLVLIKNGVSKTIHFFANYLVLFQCKKGILFLSAP
jgi:hypothetical protein